jgi:hypothetical protein
MPKAAAAAVPAIARAAGQTLGLTEETIKNVYSDRAIAPGQLRILTVDPGDKHVGMAVGLAFAQPHPETGAVVAEDELVVAFEVGHIDGIFAIDTAVNAGWVDLLVVEDWKLYKDKLEEQVGSRCETARMLGAIEHIVRKYNRFAETTGDPNRVELVQQPASVQKVAKDKLREYRMDRTSKPDDRHALSAECHFWFLVFNRRGLIE